MDKHFDNTLNTDKLVNYGYSLLENNQHERALKHFFEILPQDPENIDIYTGIAAAYIHLRDYDNAIKYAHEALRLDPVSFTSNYYLGEAYFHKRDTVNAKKFTQKAIELSPNNASPYSLMAQINYFCQSADIEKCFYYANQALKLNPNSHLPYMIIGLYYSNKNNFLKSKEFYLKSLEINPQDETTFNNYSALLHSYGKYDEAYNWMLEAVRLNPNVKLFRKNFKLMFFDNHPLLHPKKWVNALNARQNKIQKVYTNLIIATIVLAVLISILLGSHPKFLDIVQLFTNFICLPLLALSVVLFIALFLQDGLYTIYYYLIYPIIYLHYRWCIKRGRFKEVNSSGQPTDELTEYEKFQRERDFLIENKQYKKAIKYSLDNIEKFYHGSDILYGIGETYYLSNDFHKAGDYLQQAVNKDPMNTQACYILSKLQCFYYNDINKSVEYIQNCMLQDPDNIKYLIQAGVVSYFTDELDKLYNILDELESYDTLNPIARLLEALYYLKTEDIGLFKKYYHLSCNRMQNETIDQNIYKMLIKDIRKFPEAYNHLIALSQEYHDDKIVLDNARIAFKERHFLNLFINWIIPVRRKLRTYLKQVNSNGVSLVYIVLLCAVARIPLCFALILIILFLIGSVYIFFELATYLWEIAGDALTSWHFRYKYLRNL